MQNPSTATPAVDKCCPFASAGKKSKIVRSCHPTESEPSTPETWPDGHPPGRRTSLRVALPSSSFQPTSIVSAKTAGRQRNATASSSTVKGCQRPVAVLGRVLASLVASSLQSENSSRRRRPETFTNLGCRLIDSWTNWSVWAFLFVHAFLTDQLTGTCWKHWGDF
ncbi:hypothetical protein LZ30DRAFT_137601 [Colletotrichum cereale]|nr:hypothetical protein LZ30DRAFT_137601 [Colletotrichum cereale]